MGQYTNGPFALFDLMNPDDGQNQDKPAQPTGPPVFIFPQIRPINFTVAQETHLPSIKM
jgi:hypothetical protein